MNSFNFQPCFLQQHSLKARRNIQTGFTLIEVIVVTAIIGIMSAFLVGTLVQDDGRLAKLEAERFVSVVNELTDEAIISGVPYKLSFHREGYAIAAISSSNGRASGVGADELARDRKVASEVRIQIDFFETQSDDEEFDPSIVIDSLGTISPFVAKFSASDVRYIVSLDDYGSLELKSDSQ